MSPQESIVLMLVMMPSVSVTQTFLLALLYLTLTAALPVRYHYISKETRNPDTELNIKMKSRLESRQVSRVFWLNGVFYLQGSGRDGGLPN